MKGDNKELWKKILIAIVLGLIVFSVVYSVSTLNPRTPPSQTIAITNSSNYTQAAQQLFDKVVERITELRGYRPDVPLEIVTKEWVLKKWGSPAVDVENLKDEEVFYKSLLLVPSNFSFERRKNEEVGGFMAFYWENKVYVVKENFDPNSKSGGEALAHELEHVIQDMYFNIKHDTSFDGDKAYGAIVEGDAVLMGWLYAGKDIKNEIKEIDSNINCSFEPNNGYHRESNLNYLYFFPYTFGARYIAEIYLKGGYTAVDDVLRNPPVTTSQILHPSRKANFNLDVRLNESDTAFLNSKIEDGRVVKNTRMGEFFIYVFLSSHLKDCEASKAADGWIGDRLKILREGNEFVYYWKIIFDSKGNAEEFGTALKEMLQKVGYGSDGDWITKGEYVKERIRFTIKGNEVLIAGYGET